MSAATRLEVAREQIEKLPAQKLDYYSDSDKLWHLSGRVGVPVHKLDLLFRRERYRRGLLKLEDFPPHERRELIDKDKLDLHAIAAGPIMDAGEIYLPAGKIGLAEAKAREAAQWTRA